MLDLLTDSVPNPVVRGALAVTTELSIVPALEISAELVPFHAAATNLEEQGLRVRIDSQDAFQRGTEFLSLVKQYSDQLEAYRSSVYMPTFNYGKFIQALFKPLQTRFESLSKQVGALMLSYQNAERERLEAVQAAARRKQEEEALALAAEREKQGDTEAASAIMEAATMAPMPIAAPRIAVTNSFGQRAQTTARWVGAVAEPMTVLKAILNGQLPISLLEWRQAELNKFAAGIKDVGVTYGIKVAQEETLGMRR